MGDYRFKDPTPAGREFLVAKFNQTFNCNVNYRFFKEKLDQLKRKYKKYKHLMKNSTGISVDPITSVISASDSWWKDRESQYSLHQRREELMNDGQNHDEDHLYSETYGGDMQHTEVPETQENEEIPTSRVQQRGGLRQGSSSQRGVGNSRGSARSGSQGSRRKQSFETTLTDTMNGFREFQRQSLQQLRPNSFDEDDYNEFDTAVKIFESMELPNDTNFYWACIHALKEERFWRKYFMDRAERTIEDKLKFLQALTGYTHNEFVGKRLESGQKFGSPTCGQWNSGFQQWGTPPNAPQWSSPSNAPQWSTPPNAPQWSTPPNAPQWGTPPGAPQWSSSPNVPQWGTQHVPQWGAPQNTQQWGSSPSTQQWGPTSAAPQWGLITDHSSMGIITRCSTIYSSEKCSTWIFPRNRSTNYNT
ncbi:uncharacterized protein LOC106350195 [Brassica napus]|uniref:uncharacterized protein LOC106350195 n=1 Tax=Brassica napus TaxID=3708 RepID=UPI0006AAECBE|nr:uncharacterized protein LOC106350195 [Brassica napus]